MHVASRIERLESRMMLASDADVAAFGGKLEPRVWDAVQEAINSRGATPPRAQARTDASGDVQLDLHVTGKLSVALHALVKLGVRIGATDDADGVVELWAPPAL